MSTNDPDKTGSYSRSVSDALAFDIAEGLIRRLRAGERVDAAAACGNDSELLDRVETLVRQAAAQEGFRYQPQAPGATSPSAEAVTTDDLTPDPAAGSAPATGGASPAGYEIVREIARGGMGVVYEAHQLRLNRVVALKMVLGADPKGLIRFLAEAEAIASVRHPNVVQVYESGQHAGRPYLAMEYCSGGTMADALTASGRMAPRAAVELMARVAAGVAEAHDQGIVHRDLKPGNVLFDAKGVPKVADFGLAKRGPGGDLTHTQAVLGTPAYMSPEQARGETKFVGPAADVWALGVMLFEALTGRRPFDGDNMIAILEQVKDGSRVGVRSVAREVPRDVELIVHKCLATEPRERYATARELARDLDNWLAGRPILAKPVGTLTQVYKWAKRNPSRAALVAFAALVAVGLGVAQVVYQRRMEAVRVESQVERLRAAPPGELAALREALHADRARAEPLVRAAFDRARSEPARDPRAELNAALVLVAWDAEHVPFLVGRALSAGPDDVLAIREALPPAGEVRAQLLGVVGDPARPRAERLRALALLAPSGAPVPAGAVAEIASQLLVEDRLQLSVWIRALEPVKAGLIGVLAERYAQNPDTDTGVGAALVLRDYLRGDPARVVPLIGKGGRRQAFLIGAALRDHADGVRAVRAEWDRFNPVVADEIAWFDHEEGGTAEAARRTNVGLALLAAGHPEPVWRALATSDEPQLRTNLISAFAAAGVPPQTLAGALSVPEPGVRQAVYLAWGEYAVDLWSTAEFESTVAAVARDFASHPDPGVHSAAESLLRKWNQGARLKAGPLPSAADRGGRDWFANAHGMTFAVIPGPVTARIGSHPADWGFEQNPVFGPESLHRRRIGRAYALATTEVTLDQFDRFAKEHPNLFTNWSGKGWSSRTGDCPAMELDWYSAARFCRWLGEKEGIPEDQQCYPSLGEIAPGMRLPADHLDRTGYRLPTEAEWEHACRAGSRTHYWFGSDVEAISAHAWWLRSARGQTRPVGQLRPNPFGLFDVHGNVFEWCGTGFAGYPQAEQLTPVVDDAVELTPLQPDNMCVLRGGDFPVTEARLRSAHRTVVRRDFRWPASGLRVARTVSVPALDVYRIEGDDTRARFAVRGPLGRFRVSAVSGGVTVAVTEGGIPGTVEVVSPDRQARAYSFVVERLGSPDLQTVSDEFLPTEWAVRWHAWPRNPDDPNAAPTAAGWERASSGPVLHEGKAARLDYGRTVPVPRGALPAAHYGFVATARVAVTGGAYRIEAVKPGGGFRVKLGGDVLLAQGWPGRVHRPSAVLHLPPGAHDLTVEAFHITGDFHFDFRITATR